MRNVAKALIDRFGNQYNSDVNTYLSEQWVRQSEYKNCTFSLSDVDENLLIKSTMQLIGRLNLKAEELIQHTMIRPYVNLNGEIAPVISFKVSFYQNLLSLVAKTQSDLINTNDKVEFRGKDKPISCIKGKKCTDYVGGVINGKTNEGESFSLIINNEQWVEIVKSYSEIKLNGTEFFDVQWENEAFQVFLFHRLIDEFVGTLLNDESLEAYEKYRGAVDFENSFYNEKAEVSKIVFSKRGYPLGKTVKLFDGADVLAAKNASKQVVGAVGVGSSKIGSKKIKIVVDNSKSKPLNPASVNEDGSFTEWGGF